MSYLFSNLKRSFSSVSLTATAQRIQNLLQPAKITAGLLPEDLGSSVEFKLRNGTDHFTLPLQRIVFTYSPQKGDSSALMEYLSKNIVNFAKEHPTVEVIVSCKFSARAKIEAFYNGDFQHRRLVYVSGGKKLTARDVQLQVERLRDNSGMKAQRFKMQVVSETPAIRPIYSQFLHPNPRTRFNFNKK